MEWLQLVLFLLAGFYFCSNKSYKLALNIYYFIRLSMMKLNLFAMIPTPWCARFIHVSNGHKVFCRCHPTKQSESHNKLISTELFIQFSFCLSHPLTFTSKVRKTLRTRYICGPSCFTAEKHHIQWHRIVQSKQVPRYVWSLYSKRFNWIFQFCDISKIKFSLRFSVNIHFSYCAEKIQKY